MLIHRPRQRLLHLLRQPPRLRPLLCVTNKFVFKGSRPAILDFYADWCGPCRSLSPKLEAAAKKYAGKVDVYKINVDNEAELANIFGVRSIPMVLFIPMQGTPVQTVGDLTAEQIEETIAQIYKAK